MKIATNFGLLFLLLISGCTDEPTPLVISDLTPDKVVIQADDEESRGAVLEKAREGCAIHRRTPLPLSTARKCGPSTSCQAIGRQIYCGPDNCWKEHLFACVE